MSQILSNGSGGGAGTVKFLAGNSGGNVGPDGSGVINVVGTGAVSIAGNAGTNTLTVSVSSAVATSYATDSGTAVPVGNVLTIHGANGISTSGAGSTVTITGTSDTTFAYTNVSMSPYVVLTTDQYLSVDCSGGAIQLNFPNAATSGQYWIVKDRTGNAQVHNITITTVGGAVNIDGATTYVMNTKYSSVEIIGNATTYELF